MLDFMQLVNAAASSTQIMWCKSGWGGSIVSFLGLRGITGQEQPHRCAIQYWWERVTGPPDYRKMGGCHACMETKSSILSMYVYRR